MSEPGSLPWTDEQWALVQRTAAESARRARTASTFLPLVGPLPESQASVPRLQMDLENPGTDNYRPGISRLAIDDAETMKLATLSIEVFVKTNQADDPKLESVLHMVSRAAVVIGRLEDAIVLRGQPGADLAPVDDAGNTIVQPIIYWVSGGGTHRGLRWIPPVPVPPKQAQPITENVKSRPAAQYGENLVQAVVRAISGLEGRGHYGPFGAMFGHKLYAAAHEPSQSLVLPADRFVPFLGGGPLLRSSALPDGEGVIVATAGAPVDLVVAGDIHVSYLQRTTEPRYVLRVSERLALRVKEPEAIARLLTT